MILVTITAMLAVCSADKLDRTYLPPSSAQSAGGSPGSLQTPFASKTFNQGLGGLPHGSFNNEYDGVVVDAPAAGTRSSEFVPSGLGAPRVNYGSSHSKVGEAAFKDAPQQQPFGRFPGAQSSNNQQNGGQGAFQNSNTRQDFTNSNNFQGAGSTPQQPERPQAAADRSANTVKFESDVDTDKFTYAFETDNGITAEENGVDNNGIQAKGGFSYTGDDGQVYSVTYTADEGGYKPQGSHLPTPPPIPEEILKSLEKNAQDEAAGIIDDGSYDARKYNAGSEYTERENDSKYNGGTNVFGNRRESAVTSSGSFNQDTFARPGQNIVHPSSSSTLSGSGASSQTNTVSNGFRPSSDRDQNEQSGQLVGVSNENPSLNNKPSPSYRPQVPEYNNAAQSVSQKGQQNVRDSDSIGAIGLFNGNQDKSKPVFGNYNGLNSPQNFGNRPPGFINSQSTSNTVSTDSNKLQTSSRLSPNNEYLPPTNSLTSGANKPQGSFYDTSRFFSQNIQSSANIASGSNQPSRQSLQQNSFQESSASVQGLGLAPTNSQQISSTLISQNVNNRFNYQQPTLQPDSGLTTPIDESSPFSSNSRQPSFSSQYSRPTGQNPTYSMTSNIKNSEKPSIEFPKTVPSSASVSASADFQATVPTFHQTISANRQSSLPSYQSNQNKQVFRPSAITQNNLNIVSQNQASQSSINPNSQYQDNNDAYYYNQPEQSRNTPNQPSLPANQFNRIPQQTPSSEQNIQTSGFLNQGPSTTVTYPVPQTVAPTVPTSATQNNLGLNKVPQFSGITQATATSFVSHASSQSFENLPQTQQGSRFPAQPSKPAFEKTPTVVVPSFPQSNQRQNINKRPSIGTQQSGYTGEIYQYNKPPQVFTAPDVKSEDEKNTSFEISQSKVKAPTGGVKPQFGSNPSFTQQSKGEIYDYKKPPQVFTASAETKEPELNAPSRSEVQAQTTPQPQFGQFSYQSAKPTNTNQQTSENIGSDGSSIRPSCCKQVPQTSSLPTGSSSASAISSVSTQSGPDAFGFQGTQSSNQGVGGRGEVFSESRKPPSYDPETGYHY